MANELSVRFPGGAVAPRVDDSKGSVQDRDASLLVILIHGFNTSQDAARGSYGAFTTQLWHVLPAGLGEFRVWEVHGRATTTTRWCRC